MGRYRKKQGGVTVQDLRLNLAQVARYLGYGGKPLDAEMLAEIEAVSAKLRAVATPRAIHRAFSLEDTSLQGTTLCLEGDDIAELLKTSHKCLLFALTLGRGVDQALQRLQIQNLSRAVVLDACASSMIECLCQDMDKAFRLQYQVEGVFLTTRFSPGYGDLPLYTQDALCALLESPKTIGLTVASNHLLNPSKSITAIVGVSHIPQPTTRTACSYCALSGQCHYQKGGAFCE